MNGAGLGMTFKSHPSLAVVLEHKILYPCSSLSSMYSLRVGLEFSSGYFLLMSILVDLVVLCNCEKSVDGYGPGRVQ